MAHAHHSDARFAADRKGFGQEVVECLTLREPFAEFHRLVLQLFIRELLHLGFQLVYRGALLAVLADEAVIAAAENLGEQRIKH